MCKKIACSTENNRGIKNTSVFVCVVFTDQGRHILGGGGSGYGALKTN